MSGWEKNAKILDIDIHFCGFSFIHSYNILWASLTGLEYGMGLITFTSFHVPLSHDPSRGGVRARAHYAANLKLCLEATTSNVWFPAMDNLLDGEIYLCTGALGQCACCGISTEHEFATKPDGVPLMPTSHGCEDDECVHGSAISSATAYVVGLIICTDWNFHVQFFLYYFRGHCSIIWYIWNQSVLSVVPWLL